MAGAGGGGTVVLVWAPAAADFGGGTLRLGMRRGRGRAGDGGLRLPSGELGYGRWAWDATLASICRGHRAGGLFLQILFFFLKEESLKFFGELLVVFFFFFKCPAHVSLALALVSIQATFHLGGTVRCVSRVCTYTIRVFCIFCAVQVGE